MQLEIALKINYNNNLILFSNRVPIDSGASDILHTIQIKASSGCFYLLTVNLLVNKEFMNLSVWIQGRV